MLSTYLHRFQRLRVARSRQHGEAPYKPALLLAVLEGIADGSITGNRIVPQTQGRYRARAGEQALTDIRRQMLEEPTALYRRHVLPADELDLTVRSGLFKRVVLEAYDHTCAVSGLKLLSTRSSPVPLLDACHIVPWAVSHDDTISNGVALCPNLHRAFDRHLFWIDDAYRVRVADDFGELSGADYGIRRFEGQALRLPQRPKWWPGREKLAAQADVNF
jgi:putative restriction endonuclease